MKNHINSVTIIFLSLCLTLLYPDSAYSVDRHYIDSVEQVYQTSRNRKEKLYCLYILTYEHGYFNPRKGLAIGTKFLQEAQKDNDTGNIVRAFNGMANCYETLMKYDSALYLNELCYNFIKTGNKYNIQFATLCNMALCHKKLGHYHLAVEYYNKASKIIDQMPEHNIRFYYYLCELYLRIKNYKKAREHVISGLQLTEKVSTQKEYFRAIFYGYMGTCFEKLNRRDSAFYYLRKSVSGLKNETDTLAQAIAVSFLADAHLTFRQPDSAAVYFEKAISLYEKLGNHPYANFTRIKKYFSETVNNPVNKPKILTALAETEKNMGLYGSNYDLLLDAYSLLSKTFENLKEYPKALYYTQAADALAQSMLDREKQMIILDFEKSFETLKKEKQINELKNRNRINELQIENKSIEIRRYALFTSLIAVFFIGFLLVLVLYFRKKKALLKAAHELNLHQLKQKERYRISKDLHDDIGSGLNKIFFLGELISKEAGSNDAITQLSEKMKNTSNRLISNMRDMIWALDEENLQTETLVARIREYSYDYLEEKNITLNFSAKVDHNSNINRIETVRTIISVVKEILSNVLKHSQATKVSIEIVKEGRVLQLLITDNGIGYEIDKVKLGNGIKNMQKRALEIGAEIFIESKQTIGTRITLIVDL